MGWAEKKKTVKAEGRKRKAGKKGGRRKAKGGRRKAKGERRNAKTGKAENWKSGSAES
jgi:hypothetical protein